MLPYSVDMLFPSGTKVFCNVVSVWADNARRGVTKTMRATRRETPQYAQLRNASFSRARRKRHNEIFVLIDGASGCIKLRRPQVNFGSWPPKQRERYVAPKLLPICCVKIVRYERETLGERR